MNSLQFNFNIFFKEIKNKKILDVGCGDKQYQQFIDSSNEYLSIDVEDSGRDLSEKHADIFYDGINLPFCDESIDAVIYFEGIGHE
jgi:hypothetical protein